MNTAVCCRWGFVFLLMGVNAFGQTNSWTSPVTGNWHDLSWLQGVRPSLTQSAVLITNSGSKAVIIGATTVNSYASSLSVSNLVVAGTSDSTNTVVLNYTGQNLPLNLFNSCLVSTNGVLLNLFSSIRLQGNSPVLTIDGGQVNQDGGSNVFPGICYVGANGYGYFDLTNGTTTLETVYVGDNAGGMFNQFNGTAIVQTDLAIGANGVYRLASGNLFANDVTVGRHGSGSFYQGSGTAWVTNSLVVGPYGTIASYYLTNGTLQTGVSIISDDGIGTFIQYGGLHQAGWMTVGGGYSYYGAGTYVLSGGRIQTPSLGILASGSFAQYNGTNAADTLTVSGSYDCNGGSVVSSNLSVYTSKYGQGSLSIDGGQVTASNLIAMGIYLGDALITLQSGSLQCDKIQLLAYSTLQHFGGTLSNRSEITLAGGRLVENSGGESFLGALVIGDSSGSFPSRDTLPNTATIQQFAASADRTWSAAGLLLIENWNGSVNGGGLHRIYFGNSAAGLSSWQLSRIRFSNTVALGGGTYYAKLLSTGELVPTLEPTLIVTRDANSIVISWPDNLILQSANNAQGPYTDVTGASSPYTIQTTAALRQFFRVRH